MKKQKGQARVLALDLHPRSFGYVVVEGPSRLLDWGVCSYRGKGLASDVLVRKRLRPLLDLWRPALLVLHSPPTATQKANPRMGRLLKRILAQAKNLRISVCRIKEKPENKLTKYENARRIAEQFPVLVWELTPKRRAWESEHYRMSIFAAAALAIRATARHERLYSGNAERRPGMALATAPILGN